MRRRLLVLAGVFVAVFAAAYLVTWETGSSVSAAGVATVAVGFLWIVAHDVRRRPWPSESQRGHDVAYTAAAIAALHVSGQAGSDCPSGFDGFSGGCDVGGV